jgi:hypothetical protein
MDLYTIIKRNGCRMSNKTTENFLQAWNEFVWPEEIAPSYRLYYNDDGTPKCYSMEDQPGKYVDIDAETFALRPWNVRVVEGKFKLVQPPITVQKLQPNQIDGTSCHPQDVCVVVSEQKSHIKWNSITNEIN